MTNSFASLTAKDERMDEIQFVVANDKRTLPTEFCWTNKKPVKMTDRQNSVRRKYEVDIFLLDKAGFGHYCVLKGQTMGNFGVGQKKLDIIIIPLFDSCPLKLY